ncbi:hypothetical protein DR62_06600 [Burkholderia thailandensis]|uniref:Uncharacterized protein n=1 Tax=Burkholderia thailandensis TaxID=57975 RepID=A0AAW9CZ30_BURTH|nr:hypothetical protein DR62_06600 [Burkholderia thailandensis]AOI52207.1 hypothetical protein WI24_10595 [Burkholderia thailandensis]MDW9239899.1 hypothetical protein [Burkholderia thailandensis]MDW9254102.1 hypothetical protein [Burkholderia thailandensis]
MSTLHAATAAREMRRRSVALVRRDRGAGWRASVHAWRARGGGVAARGDWAIEKQQRDQRAIVWRAKCASM